ncbi:MAG TPA: hypothetical protein VMT18_05540, partial [Planctomycetota bacterium]|nr:hypothetical protein [Planctomycetota bacterium]
MKSKLFAVCALTLVSADRELSTVYTAETALQIETRIELELESTMSMVRDGEPVEGRGFGGGGSNSAARGVTVDRYLEAAGGAASRVQRRWEQLEGELTMDFGGEERSLTLESDFEDLVVEIARDEDGELAVEVVEGTGPDIELLERLRPGLALDAFLAGEAVAEGTEWPLESEAIRRGLGLEISLFRAPEREDGGAGRGGRGRGGFGGRGGGPDSLLAGVEWSGRATFSALEVFEGVECARIALEIEGESESDDENVSSTTEVELEGTLWFDLAARRPIGLEIEGRISSEMDMTRERDGSLTEIHRE